MRKGSPNRSKLALGERITHTKPPFTITQIKKSIPSHCFNRSLYRSFSYVIFDSILLSTFYYVATTYFHTLSAHPLLLHYLAWPLYWLSQGIVFTGFWVIAHECGHHAFSDYQFLDDFLGFLLHSSLLIPYFSFKISHRRHHANTASLHRDEVFVPKPKSKIPCQWDWLRGNLVTVDRDYGKILNKMLHNITDTHVIHHLFPSMPHYNAAEATRAVKEVLGEYYQFDETPILKAAWREFRECVYVEEDDHEEGDSEAFRSKGVFWFRNKL
ncbi:hypothetical protein Csa_017882 [Cucumis sativus]|nr:hypothetical protein Csa_017882 [Cucumis sativus]